jgi:hypothetical protein
MKIETKIELPKFYELAEARIEGGKQRTVNIKVTVSTCRMMIQRERGETRLLEQLIDACRAYVHARKDDGASTADLDSIADRKIRDAMDAVKKAKRL